LGQIHHFVRGFLWHQLDLVKMGERNDHHVSGCVWEAIENDETILSAINNESFVVL
jgi:hypothetical protein